ncbi:preprotein translocase subunit YajC [Sediminitomix flava]|uniref:Sec translocon accessory complex subunit YajC n=1 Tax=Sediminitomix flava TaxID=379075 RepID=A0A315Z0R3_SEDFL|nr:preprotein translocase subunit YajC [Sediminitomix flava]PWJ36101.1 preprotein translocase subunit YajC [Sediminitomix flava]
MNFDYTTVLLQAPAGNGGMMNIIFIVGMVAVFYFLILRPQQQDKKKQAKFSDAIKKGDNVVTIGGIHGKIVAIEDNTVTLDVDGRGAKMKFERSSISMANTNAAYGKEEKKK